MPAMAASAKIAVYSDYKSISDTSSSGLSTYADALRAQGYTVEQMYDPITSSKLNGYDALLIIGLDEYLSTSEKSAIEDFVETQDKGLLLSGGTPSVVNDLAQSFTGGSAGWFGSYIVCDPTDYEVYPKWVKIRTFYDHPITENLNRIIVYKGTNVPAAWAFGGIIGCAYSDDDSWLDEDGDYVYDSGESRGAQPVLAYSSWDKIVIVPDGNVFDNSDADDDGVVAFNEYDNDVLGLNIVKWLSGDGSNGASGTFEILRNGHSDIGPKHKYLDCGEYVNYFDISVKFWWEDSGIEIVRIDASTGESFESGSHPISHGEDEFILDAEHGKVTINYIGWESDSEGWHYKFSYLIEEESESEKPDLIVSSINFNPNPANKYDDVIVSVTVKNQGNGDAGPHYEFLGYPDRYTILKEWYCSGLEAGASETFTHTLENVQHSDTYEACADWGQAVQESDDTNNCLTAYLEVKESEDKPDLTITDISWSPEFPTSLDVVTYTVEITNIGTATAEDFILTLDIDGVEVKEIDSLLPGKSCIQDFTIRQQCGYYHVMASVDPNHLIDERDDNNNDMVKHITIDCGGSVERALIIGIEDYKDGDDLNQRVVNSAQGMYDLLRWGYGYEQENVVLLLNEDATYNRIIFETKRLGSETDENDKLIFYYTGHGVKNETLETEGIVPYDAKVDDGKYVSNFFYEITGLFDLFFEDDFDGSLIAIFDTCYSGGFSKETDCDGDRNGIDGDRRVILMSVRADEDQFSHTHHSQIFFTRYLLDAFASHSNDADRNVDQRVSVEEAFNYACTECESLPWPATQHPQIMDHYLDESNREAELHISNELIVDKRIAGEGGSSVHIHAYDSEGRHVGITDSDNIVSEIPGAWYSGPESHPEEIIIFGISEDITFTIEGQVDETFNFTIRQFTDANEIIVNYDDVSIKETGIATVDVNQKNPTYTMEIDDDGDDTPEHTTVPDSIEINGQITYSLQLHTGWNLISIPLVPEDSDIDSVFSSISGNYSVVWTTTSTGGWKSSNQAFGRLTDITVDKGYLIYMTAPDTLVIEGTKPASTIIDLASGWNLVGYPSQTTRSITDVLSGVSYGVVWTTTSTGGWKSSDQAFGRLTDMSPGNGYMIYAPVSGSYTVN